MSQKFYGVSASIFALLLLSPCQAQQVVDFPAAKTGGNYMHNYYLPPPSSTPFWPAWSPSGEEIAFSMQGSIWKIHMGDTTAYELTSAATYDSSPAWSPDGKWIVYTAEQDSRNINLRSLNLSTGETHAPTAGRVGQRKHSHRRAQDRGERFDRQEQSRDSDHRVQNGGADRLRKTRRGDDAGDEKACGGSRTSGNLTGNGLTAEVLVPHMIANLSSVTNPRSTAIAECERKG